MDKIAEVLQELAKQLGTTVQHMWPIFVAQQRIEGITYISMIALSYLILFFTARYSRKGKWESCDSLTKYGVVGVCTIICGAATTAILLMSVPTIVTKLMNPEYSALQSLMGMVTH